MKALVQTTYGGPESLSFSDAAEPVVSGPHDVLIRVRACALNAADWHVMRADPWPVRFVAGLRAPKVPSPGSAVAGVVESVGAEVTRVRPGDEVMAEIGRGGLAELALTHEKAVALKPAGISVEQAACLPLSGTTALQGLRDKGGVKAGERVLVIGASGGVGATAVQMAVALGAEVTGVTSTRNLELVRSLGAAHVVDYTAADVTTLGETYDLVLDIVGEAPVGDLARLLAPGGRYVAVALGTKPTLGYVVSRNLALALGGLRHRRPMSALVAKGDRDDLAVVASMAAAGDLAVPVERTYALADGAAALAHLESGRTRGKLVVTI